MEKVTANKESFDAASAVIVVCGNGVIVLKLVAVISVAKQTAVMVLLTFIIVILSFLMLLEL